MESVNYRTNKMLTMSDHEEIMDMDMDMFLSNVEILWGCS